MVDVGGVESEVIVLLCECDIVAATMYGCCL